jgi:tetratricopeptide (TPR) repeat protein
MNKLQITTAALSLSALLIAGNASAQSAEDIVKAKFPEVAGELAITPSTTYNPALKVKYRDLYTKMNKGIEEIVTVEHIGVNEMPELQFFDARTLKDMQKAGTLPDLKSAIRAEQQKIANLMREEPYGADSATCVRVLSTFQEYVKQNALEEAYPTWSVLFREFPKCSQSVYSNGVNIMKKKMQTAKTGKEQQVWVDTLMMVYDQRIKYFAATSKLYGEAYLLGRKGVDIVKYRKGAMDEAYNILMKSIDLGGKNSEYAVIQTAMQTVITQYNAEKIDASVVVDKYLLFSDILAQKKAEDKAKLDAATDDKAKQKAEADLATCAQVEGGVLGLVSNSTAAQCDVLVNAFSAKFKENPNDMELCNKIVKVLGSKECTDSQLYEDAASKVIASNPTETACAGFAKMLEKRGKEDEALENYKKAISLAETDTMKAKYNCSIAKILQKKGQYVNSRSYARQSIELNPKYGLPYIIIATLYGSNPVGEDSFEKSKTYWLVIDYLQKAKAADPSVANEAQQLINRYIGSCPKKEEAFMHSITPGMSITIGGWIGESTTARF